MLRELEKMCLQKEFNRVKADLLMKQVDINEEFQSLDGWNVILLECSVEGTNAPMAELLLENGANPNRVFNDGESILWNLQYDDGETAEENEERLKIAQLLLEHGADPYIDPDKTGECLFDYVTFSVFNDDYDELWEYRSRFYILLIAYGAQTEYCCPNIVGDFDKANMQQYQFVRVPKGNGKYSGVITDGQGHDVAFV